MRFTRDLARMHDEVAARYVRNRRICLGVVVFFTAVLVATLIYSRAWARDLGQWENSDPAIRAWYKSLMQPDHPESSCCGEADGYWCDDLRVEGGKNVCTITDDRDDGPLGRPHIPVGTVIEIPDHKLKYDRGNPTGHGIVFLSYRLWVFCYVQGGGV